MPTYARLRSQGTGVHATAQARQAGSVQARQAGKPGHSQPGVPGHSQPGNGGPPAAQAPQVSKYKKRKIRELVGMSDVEVGAEARKLGLTKAQWYAVP
jgi:hypothetical protein